MREALRRLLNAEVTHEPCTGRDTYSKRQFGSSATYKARVEPTRKLVSDPQGQQVVASSVAFIEGPGPERIDPQDRITLPDGSAPRILTAMAVPDRDQTIHHHEVYFGGGPV